MGLVDDQVQGPTAPKPKKFTVEHPDHREKILHIKGPGMSERKGLGHDKHLLDPQFSWVNEKDGILYDKP